VGWSGTVVGAAPTGSAWDLPGDDYCRWEPTGGGYIIARGLTPAQFGQLPREFSQAALSNGILLDTVRGHPDVPDDVIAAHAAFGRYGFWLEGSEEVLGLEVLLADPADDVDWPEQEKMLFRVANSFLRDMNWVPEDPQASLDWLDGIHRTVAVSGQGPVFVSSAREIAAFDEADGWALVDLEGLPEGAGVANLGYGNAWPGRLILNVAASEEGELWVAGHAFSPIEDVEFGGSVSEWGEPHRWFTWLARGDCERDRCAWRTFTPDDIPALSPGGGIGALAVTADGTLYAAMGDNQLLVVNDIGGTSLTVPYVPVPWDHSVSPWARTFAIGPDGVLWAGTNGGHGLVTFDGTTFGHVTTDDGLPSDKTSRVAAAIDGTIWVVTDDTLAGTKVFASFDGTDWTYDDWSVHTGDLFLGPQTAVDANGVQWTVRSDELTSFDGTTRRVYSIPSADD